MLRGRSCALLVCVLAHKQRCLERLLCCSNRLSEHRRNGLDPNQHTSVAGSGIYPGMCMFMKVLKGSIRAVLHHAGEC